MHGFCCFSSLINLSDECSQEFACVEVTELGRELCKHRQLIPLTWLKFDARVLVEDSYQSTLLNDQCS